MNGCTRRHSRLLSYINHTLKHRFSRHIDEAVFKTENFLSITAEDSLRIATVGLLQKLHLVSESLVIFHLHISAYYSLNIGLLFRGQCATFGTCLALICTKNRLKSLEVTVVETSKIRDLQPFSHFTKNY